MIITIKTNAGCGGSHGFTCGSGHISYGPVPKEQNESQNVNAEAGPDCPCDCPKKNPQRVQTTATTAYYHQDPIPFRPGSSSAQCGITMEASVSPAKVDMVGHVEVTDDTCGPSLVTGVMQKPPYDSVECDQNRVARQKPAFVLLLRTGNPRRRPNS